MTAALWSSVTYSDPTTEGGALLLTKTKKKKRKEKKRQRKRKSPGSTSGELIFFFVFLPVWSSRGTRGTMGCNMCVVQKPEEQYKIMFQVRTPTV